MGKSILFCIGLVRIVMILNPASSREPQKIKLKTLALLKVQKLLRYYSSCHCFFLSFVCIFLAASFHLIFLSVFYFISTGIRSFLRQVFLSFFLFFWNKMWSEFLWHGTLPQSSKACLVNWDLVCTPKQMGGLGVMDLRTFNNALLMKWRCHWESPKQTVCKHIITFTSQVTDFIPQVLLFTHTNHAHTGQWLKHLTMDA